ncbi:carbohydrate ABC transporter permease [Leifsonia poae]|uniref:carbohydrate ABC transporter permease n=1 Tax=Leifsonia poae TaxID=110933 RepID=UPI001CBC83F8|nr:sugar ABC transporter permease [Leifsonia poae]
MSRLIDAEEATGPQALPTTARAEAGAAVTDREAARAASRRRPKPIVPILMLAPAVLGIAIFVLIPALLALVASFFSIPLGGGAWGWVGFGNFAKVLGDPTVQKSIVNTLVYAAITIVPSLVIGLVLALLADSIVHGRALVRTILFLPMTANLVAMAVVFRWIFAYQGGFANQLLGLVGLGPVNWLGDTHTSLLTVAIVGIWRSASFTMMIFFAGLATIPTSIGEATASEGIRGWTKLTRVTLPMMKPTVAFATVITILGSVQVFDTINVMTQGGPQNSSETLLLTTWRYGFGYFDLGSASALSLLLLLALVGVGILQRRFLTGGQK